MYQSLHVSSIVRVNYTRIWGIPHYGIPTMEFPSLEFPSVYFPQWAAVVLYISIGAMFNLLSSTPLL